MRKSIIWDMNSVEFSELIKKCNSYSEVLRHFGLQHKGGNNLALKRRIKIEGVDCSHFLQYYEKVASLSRNKRLTLEESLVTDSKCLRSCLKKRLLKEGILQNKCSICGLDSWNSKPIVMILDHINGIHNDNRLENLRMVCPNCNSQLPTFAGRNYSQNKRTKYCSSCGAEVHKSKSGKCRKCISVTLQSENEYGRRKCERPPLDVLKKETEDIGFEAVGRKYGVSGNAIRKWMK